MKLTVTSRRRMRNLQNELSYTMKLMSGIWNWHHAGDGSIKILASVAPSHLTGLVIRDDSWPELVTWSAKKKSSDSLHWTHGCDLDFVCLKLVDSNWAIWSSKKDVTKDRGSISITKDTKRHVKKMWDCLHRRGLEKCGSSLKAAKQEVWRDGSAPTVVFSSSHSSLLCILAFQNFFITYCFS